MLIHLKFAANQRATSQPSVFSERTIFIERSLCFKFNIQKRVIFIMFGSFPWCLLTCFQIQNVIAMLCFANINNKQMLMSLCHAKRNTLLNKDGWKNR